MDVVIAKYNEDVSWLSQIQGKGNIIVYDKGSGELPNIGREAHTYVHHILENYDNLSECTVFLQGKPFDHCRDVTAMLTEINEGMVNLSNSILDCDINGNPHHSGLKIAEFQELLFGEVLFTDLKFAPGAQFIVHKDLITNKSKKFWDNFLDIFVSHRIDEAPWIAERLWGYIFQSYSDV